MATESENDAATDASGSDAATESDAGGESDAEEAGPSDAGTSDAVPAKAKAQKAEAGKGKADKEKGGKGGKKRVNALSVWRRMASGKDIDEGLDAAAAEAAARMIATAQAARDALSAGGKSPLHEARRRLRLRAPVALLSPAPNFSSTNVQQRQIFPVSCPPLTAAARVVYSFCPRARRTFKSRQRALCRFAGAASCSMRRT